MKKYVLFAVFNLSVFNLFGQHQIIDTIFVNQFKSSQIVFNENITFDFIDIGTGDLHIVHRPIKNICILQSIVKGDLFRDTNIFIKTNQNTIHNFIISYDDKPKKYTYYIEDNSPKLNAIETNSSKGNNIKTTNILVENIINYNSKPFKPSSDFISDIKCEFMGSFFKDKKLYYKLKITNDSFLDYTVKDFYIYAKNKKNRNTVDSERILKPIKIYSNTETIKGKTQEYFVFEMNQFSLNRKEELMIEVKESTDGQRNFKILVPYYITNNPIVL